MAGLTGTVVRGRYPSHRHSHRLYD